MLKEIFKYRGRRIKKIHLYDWWLHFLFLLSPFFIGIGFIGFILLKPVVSDFQKAQQLIIPFLVITILLLAACFVVYLFMVWSRLKGGYFLKVKYYDMIAKMLKLSGFVIKKESRQSGKKPKEKFPKVYVKKGKHTTDVTLPLDGGQHHDRFLQLGKRLEEMFMADLVAEQMDFGFVTYSFMTDVISKRISIDQVIARNGSITLMNGVKWEYDELPHMLIAGGTGGGKTYFMYSLIKAILSVGTVYICDPKSADLSDLSDLPVFKGKIFFGQGETMIRCLEDAIKRMEQRFKYMKSLEKYESGRNYAFYGMPPEFIIFDEWKAFYGMLGRDYKNLERVNIAVQQLVMKARQAGIFLILGTQKPDSSDFPSGVRDNMMCRVTLGKLSVQGYYMVYGEESKNKAFFNKPIKGRGYIDDGSGVVREFYSPFVPKTYNFLDEFKKLECMIELKI
ncbi:FtsK/SpoIIIE domain-containing protein [Enterococcus sp. DIV1059_2]|uniref:FtsK/SpoIIIE domain-containing protein n=1 Tax=Enterococcus sp. DIV1059_2 TaxID=2774664 RepID=UPI003F23354B